MLLLRILCVSILLSVIACTSPSPTAEPVETELAVLQRTLQEVCSDEHFFPKVDSKDAAYWLSCVPAAGHSTQVHIERFDDETEAHVAFEVATAGYITQDFHGYPVAFWIQRDPDYPDASHRHWVWQAQRWLISIESFDDTHFLIALEPNVVGETIYTFAIEQGLLTK